VSIVSGVRLAGEQLPHLIVELLRLAREFRLALQRFLARPPGGDRVLLREVPPHRVRVVVLLP